MCGGYQRGLLVIDSAFCTEPDDIDQNERSRICLSIKGEKLDIEWAAVHHFLESTGGKDISCMKKSVQMTPGFFNEVPGVWVDILV